MLQQQHFEYTLYAYLGLYGDFEGARVCGRLAIVTQYGHGLGEALWHHHAGHAIYDHLWEHDRITLSVEEEYDVGDCGDFDIAGAMLVIDDTLRCSFAVLHPQLASHEAPRRQSMSELRVTGIPAASGYPSP